MEFRNKKLLTLCIVTTILLIPSLTFILIGSIFGITIPTNCNKDSKKIHLNACRCICPSDDLNCDTTRIENSNECLSEKHRIKMFMIIFYIGISFLLIWMLFIISFLIFTGRNNILLCLGIKPKFEELA